MEKLTAVDSIAIVGGGTSAWMTAAMLSHQHPHLKITIIDKEHGTPVGVGEGTLLNFDGVLRQCGFEPQDWFTALDATSKAGILFPGWGEDNSDVWHPFLFIQLHTQGTTLYDVWSRNQNYDFKRYATGLYESAIDSDSIDLTQLNNYAYHIDASKLVLFFQEKLQGRVKVTSIKSEVIDVLRDSDSHDITELILKNGQHITADLYVDCTGFKAILNHEPDRVNLEGRLFCDTAIAGHIPYNDIDKELHPYVISEQVEHGWVWNIPVQSRIGSGLVFNRTQTSIEEAKDFFVNYWDNRITKDKLKVIDWTPYYKNNIWEKNVVSIGLSAGFIEPLESTGIALIITGIEQLSQAISSRSYTETHKKCYNIIMKGYFEDSIDFVSMHYAQPTRSGKIWDWIRETFVKSPRQLHYERQMSRTDNNSLPVEGHGYMFCGRNWICWLVQMGYKLSPSGANGLNDEQTLNEMMWWYEGSKQTKWISHKEFIRHNNFKSAEK